MSATPWTERMLPHNARPGDCRGPYDLDYARVVHSEAFRRLAGVTQILAISDSDFSRNRLTHSIEVGQVALGIVQHLACTIDEHHQQILPPRALMETISAVHDIGHPPFGHGGEVVLNWLLRDHRGFESNGQTLRALTAIIDSSSVRSGANLTRRTLLGALKYPVSWSSQMTADKQDRLHQSHASRVTGRPIICERDYSPPKCYLDSEEPVVAWLFDALKTRDVKIIRAEKVKSFDCSIMDISDDISYGIHDLEDAISLNLITREQLLEDAPADLWTHFLVNLRLQADGSFAPSISVDEWFNQLFVTNTKSAIGKLIHYCVTHISMGFDERFESPLYRYRISLAADALTLLTHLKRSIFQRVILAPAVQHMRVKAQHMIIDVFDAIATDPVHLLPVATSKLWADASGETAKMRVLCDYVARLTDNGLIKIWRRFHDATSGSVFDSLR